MLLRTAQVSFVGSPSCSAKLQPVKVACQVQASGASYSTPRKDTRNLEPLYYPPQSEEVACSSAAFQAARSAALPNKLQVQGLQEYMSAIWDRRRHVTTSHGDPLLQMFDEHDVQNHGTATSKKDELKAFAQPIMGLLMFNGANSK